MPIEAVAVVAYRSTPITFVYWVATSTSRSSVSPTRWNCDRSPTACQITSRIRTL